VRGKQKKESPTDSVRVGKPKEMGKTENATEIQTATCYKISKIFSANIYINYEAHTHTQTHTEVLPGPPLFVLSHPQGLQKTHRSVTRNTEKKAKQLQK